MSNAKRSLSSLKSAFGGDDNQGQNQGQQYTNNYYPFWSMAVGQRAIIRFLPDLNQSNPRGFLVEKVTHTLTINGQVKKIPCLSMYEEDCPICKISQAYYKAKDEVNGKKYWKKRQYLGQALVVEDPLPAGDDGETHEGKVRMIALGFQIYNIIKESFASDELEGIPYDFEEGYDFIIKKTEQGNYAGYAVGTKFANRQRSLNEEELVAAEAGMVDLATLLPKNPGSTKVQAMLDAEMNGEDYNDSGVTDNTPDEDTPVHRPAPSKPAPQKDVDWEDKPVASAPVSAGDENVDDMLAQIRARRKKATTE